MLIAPDHLVLSQIDHQHLVIERAVECSVSPQGRRSTCVGVRRYAEHFLTIRNPDRAKHFIAPGDEGNAIGDTWGRMYWPVGPELPHLLTEASGNAVKILVV